MCHLQRKHQVLQEKLSRYLISLDFIVIQNIIYICIRLCKLDKTFSIQIVFPSTWASAPGAAGDIALIKLKKSVTYTNTGKFDYTVQFYIRFYNINI